jgi:hypothetical protein
MEIDSALVCGEDVIAVWRRAPSGAWTELGRVRIDAPGRDSILTALCAELAEAAGGRSRTKLVLPPEDAIVIPLDGAAGATEGALAAALAEQGFADGASVVWDRSADGRGTVAVASATIDAARRFLRARGIEPVAITVPASAVLGREAVLDGPPEAAHTGPPTDPARGATHPAPAAARTLPPRTLPPQALAAAPPPPGIADLPQFAARRQPPVPRALLGGAALAVLGTLAMALILPRAPAIDDGPPPAAERAALPGDAAAPPPPVAAPPPLPGEDAAGLTGLPTPATTVAALPPAADLPATAAEPAALSDPTPGKTAAAAEPPAPPAPVAPAEPARPAVDDNPPGDAPRPVLRPGALVVAPAPPAPDDAARLDVYRPADAPDAPPEVAARLDTVSPELPLLSLRPPPAPLPLAPPGPGPEAAAPTDAAAAAPAPPDTWIRDGAALRAAARPPARPDGIAPAPPPEQAANPEPDPAAPGVLAAAPRPPERPADIARQIETRRAAAAVMQPQAQPATQAAAPAPAAAPRVPQSASVASAATEENQLRLNQLSLIGVFGGGADRAALVRSRNGRVTQVTLNDRIDGGRIVAIGDASLTYVKNGRNMTLEMP